MKFPRLAAALLVFVAGFACGAAVFVRIQARPLPPLAECGRDGACMTDPQILGLLAAVGLRLAPGLMPDVVARSPHCVGINSPKPDARVDLVFFPTRDMRSLLDLTPADAPQLMECFALMRQVADERHITNWKVATNGPGRQEITYLHFHLLAD
jgi:hypothetical protein